MPCMKPFEKVHGVGCVWLYKEKHQTMYKGQHMCKLHGGDIYEWSDTERIPLKLYKFMSDYTDDGDDIWIGLQMAKDGNYYFKRSGKKYTGPTTRYPGIPERDNNCVHIEEGRPNIFVWPCIREDMEYTLCEIPNYH